MRPVCVSKFSFAVVYNIDYQICTQRTETHRESVKQHEWEATTKKKVRRTVLMASTLKARRQRIGLQKAIPREGPPRATADGGCCAALAEVGLRSAGCLGSSARRAAHPRRRRPLRHRARGRRATSLLHAHLHRGYRSERYERAHAGRRARGALCACVSCACVRVLCVGACVRACAGDTHACAGDTHACTLASCVCIWRFTHTHPPGDRL